MRADEQDDYSAQVIVHEFQICRAARISSPSNSAIPETSVFEAGSNLARNAICDTGWKDKRCFNSNFTLQADGKHAIVALKKSPETKSNYSMLYLGPETAATIGSGESSQTK